MKPLIFVATCFLSFILLAMVVVHSWAQNEALPRPAQLKLLVNEILPASSSSMPHSFATKKSRPSKDGLLGVTQDAVGNHGGNTDGPRVVAIGDLHGTLRGIRGALHAAKLVNKTDNWIGGTSVVVQLGDVLDRGRNELDVIMLLERLRKEARDAGGDVLTILGNHDAWNVNGMFMYAPNLTGFLPNRFAFGQKLDTNASKLLKFPVHSRHRAAAFLPGGPAARMFARTRPAIVRVDDTIFVHAVLDMDHVRLGVEKINALVAAWLNGTGKDLPSLLWRMLQDRDFGASPAVVQRNKICTVVNNVLKALNATRLVVGHTPQWNGINGVCGGKLWRVDGGLSVMNSMQKPMEVLEIRGKETRVLSIMYPY